MGTDWPNKNASRIKTRQGTERSTKGADATFSPKIKRKRRAPFRSVIKKKILRCRYVGSKKMTEKRVTGLMSGGMLPLDQHATSWTPRKPQRRGD